MQKKQCLRVPSEASASGKKEKKERKRTSADTTFVKEAPCTYLM